MEIVLENKPDSIERENEVDEFRSSATKATLVSGNTCESELLETLSVHQVKNKKTIVIP